VLLSRKLKTPYNMLRYTRCIIFLLLYLATPTPVRARPLAGTDGK
jgi:hypothetical protein